MRTDYLTYRRAASVSLMGMGLQVILAASTLVYGLMSRDHAAVTASIFMGVGVLAWLALAIVFDQHRRERVEALEAEALDADAGGSSVFESRGDEFKVAARRLSNLYKIFLPAVSGLIGAALVGGALWRLLGENGGWRIFTDNRFTSSRLSAWGLGLGIATAMVGFLFARFASGMSKQPSWANLRAGAAFTVGSALLGLAMAVGQFVDLYGPDAVLRYLLFLVPVFVLLAGVETFLQMLLDVYRPRKAGETPRPAFDSRLLGLAAAPDRIAKSINDAINYQLGFDVSGGWAYRLLSRSLMPLVLLGAVVMWLLTSLTVVEPHQRAMILRFGKPIRENVGPGLHVKAPWPIDSVYVPEYIVRGEDGRKRVADLTATGVRTVQLATPPPATTEPILWTNDHIGEEAFQIVRAGEVRSSGSPGDRVSGLGEYSLVSVEVPLKYAVGDVGKFDRLAPPEFREEVLKAAAQREITLYLQTVTLDDILGPKREAISNELRRRIEAAFDRLGEVVDGKASGSGVLVLGCSIIGVHPPRQGDAAKAFEKIVEADQKFQARLNDARASEIRSLVEAAGSVETARRIVAQADALDALTRRIAAAKGEQAAALEAEARASRAKLDEMLAQAGGYAATSLAQARAERAERHMGAKARAAAHVGQLASYEANPALFKASAYFDAMRTAVSKARVYITHDKIPDLRVTTDLKDKDTGIETFQAPAGQ